MLEERIREQYSKCNYRIDRISHNKRCIIFCSSNGLWQPHNEETFVKCFCERDKYEWENIAKAKQIREHFGKIIYIRDIYKHFYVEGINEQINTIDKLIEFLEPETKGYELVVAGHSAGGYLACILGAKLNATKVLSFGGQFNLYSWGGAKGTYTFAQCDFLTKHLADEGRAQYYDITKLLMQTQIPVFYFYGAYNEADCIQANTVTNLQNICLFGFREKRHGAAMWSPNILYILCAENDALIKLNGRFANKMIKKYVFSMLSIGACHTVVWMVSKVLKRLGIGKG